MEMLVNDFYRARFEKQNTGSALSWSNCAAASGAMLADQSTLGIKDPTPDRIRRLTNDFEGGLTMAQVGTALDRIGIHTTVYDESDGYTWADLTSDLRDGAFMVVAGDYDAVPLDLRGDKDYTGFHAVFYHEIIGDEYVVVGDPLNDGRRPGIHKGYVRWPIEVAKEYVKMAAHQIPGESLLACVMDVRDLSVRRGRRKANIRRLASRDSVVIGHITPSDSVQWGGTVKGQMIGGSDVWYKVWCPEANRIGYAHSSVVESM